MRTTVTLDESLVKELLKYMNSKTKTGAVVQAVKEQIRREKLKQLSDKLGKIDFDEEVIREGNESDMKRAQWLGDMGKG